MVKTNTKQTKKQSNWLRTLENGGQRLKTVKQKVKQTVENT